MDIQELSPNLEDLEVPPYELFVTTSEEGAVIVSGHGGHPQWRVGVKLVNGTARLDIREIRNNDDVFKVATISLVPDGVLFESMLGTSQQFCAERTVLFSAPPPDGLPF